MLARLAWLLGAGVGPLWLMWHQRRFARDAKRLTDTERRAMRPFFGEVLLDSARIAVVDDLHVLGWISKLPILRQHVGAFRPAGITLGKLIVVSADRCSGDVHETLLFHELVHVVQYSRLGLSRFCGDYVRDAFVHREYLEITAEVQAFALQARFTAGGRFSVAEELG